jgi:hypothetical protein
VYVLKNIIIYLNHVNATINPLNILMKSIIAIITLVCALAIGFTAAWFSIIGLMAIFPAVALNALSMGVVLESGKFMAATWLKHSWITANWMMKSIGMFLVAVLMFITSVGIYGLLSRGHVEQGAPVADNVARIERLEQRISLEQKEIDDAQKIINQLDDTVNTLIEYDRIRGESGAIATRERQGDQRAELKSIIDEAEENIDSLTNQKFELEQEVRVYEVEVGPIKYVAALFNENPDASDLERAVRMLIIMLIFVFDPLAVWMLIAANQSFIEISQQKTKNKKSKNQNTLNKMDGKHKPEPSVQDFYSTADNSETIQRSDIHDDAGDGECEGTRFSGNSSSEFEPKRKFFGLMARPLSKD